MSSAEFKRHLLECVEREKIGFAKIADHFHQQTHRAEHSYVALCEAVIDAVDRIEKSGDWTQSAFLKNTFAKLDDSRESAKRMYQMLTGTQRAREHAKTVQANQTKCFVSLYQSRGQDLKQWALQLMSIEKHMIGRPIYRNETDIQKVLRLKLSQTQEAYVVVAVDNQHVITKEKARVDRIGNELMTLPAGSVLPENILEFVHMGRRYVFENNVLEAVRN